MGHPIHQLLILCPFALLAAAVVLDLIDLATATGAFSVAAYWTIGAGIVAGLLVAPLQLIDWLQVPAASRARRIRAQHGVGSVLVLLLFVASWLLRDQQGLVPVAALALSLAGAIVSAVTAWLGGDLLPRLGIGVHAGADDAPSSLYPDDAPLSAPVREPPTGIH